MIKSFYITSIFYLLFVLKITAQTTTEYQFVIHALRTLAKNYDTQLAEKVKQKYPNVKKELQKKFHDIKNSPSRFAHEKIYYTYLRLGNLYLATRQCAKIALRPPRYSKRKQRRYRIKAAEEYYVAGIELLQNESRADAKKALGYFQKVNKFKPNFRDSRQKLKKAWHLAAYKINIQTDFSPLESRKINRADLEKKLIRHLKNHTFKYPIRFVISENNVKSKNNTKLDHLLNLKFNYFKIGQTYLHAEKERVSTQTDYYDYQKRVKAHGSFTLKIIDQTSNKELVNESFADYYKWLSEWGIYEGNKAELSKIQRHNCELSEPQIPSDEVLFEAFFKVAYKKIITSIDNFYQNQYIQN